ncbi:MAG: type II secretion system protein GspE, partial [Candidatus Omnitrophota bacterium]
CISEVMVVTDEMRQLITEHAPYTKIRECARRNGMQTLYDSAIKKVEAGLSSLEEALSITIGAD